MPPSRLLRVLLCPLVGVVAAGCAVGPATRPTTEPAAASGPAEPSDMTATWARATAPLGGVTREEGQVWTVTVANDELWVQSDLGDVPAAAGVGSEFHFWRCECGRTYVLGSCVAPAAEANDVIDALRAGHLWIDSVGDFFVGAKPALLCVRFHGEGAIDDLVNTLAPLVKRDNATAPRTRS